MAFLSWIPAYNPSPHVKSRWAKIRENILEIDGLCTSSKKLKSYWQPLGLRHADRELETTVHLLEEHMECAQLNITAMFSNEQDPLKFKLPCQIGCSCQMECSRIMLKSQLLPSRATSCRYPFWITVNHLLTYLSNVLKCPNWPSLLLWFKRTSRVFQRKSVYELIADTLALLL